VQVTVPLFYVQLLRSDASDARWDACWRPQPHFLWTKDSRFSENWREGGAMWTTTPTPSIPQTRLTFALQSGPYPLNLFLKVILMVSHIEASLHSAGEEPRAVGLWEKSCRRALYHSWITQGIGGTDGWTSNMWDKGMAEKERESPKWAASCFCHNHQQSCVVVRWKGQRGASISIQRVFEIWETIDRRTTAWLQMRLARAN